MVDPGVGDGEDCGHAKECPDEHPVDVVRGGEEGADGLDRVVGDAGLAGDDVTEVHLHLEVLEGEELNNEQ